MLFSKAWRTDSTAGNRIIETVRRVPKSKRRISKTERTLKGRVEVLSGRENYLRVRWEGLRYNMHDHKCKEGRIDRKMRIQDREGSFQWKEEVL